MRRIVSISCLVLVSAIAGGAVWAAERFVATPCAATSSRTLASLQPVEEYPLAKGRVVAVDPKAGTVTLAHGQITQFYLEPTTRIFHIDNRTLLTGLTPGDKIRFELERDGKKYVITRIEHSN